MQDTRDILVMDGDVQIVSVIAEILREEGYRVRTASDSENGYAAILDHPPTLILLDVFMPGTTAPMLIEHLRRHDLSDVPVVLMSTDLREAEALLAQGVADYLAKPFDIDELLACVERYASLWSSTIPRP